MVQKASWHPKTRPFDTYSKSGLVRYSDPHFTSILFCHQKRQKAEEDEVVCSSIPCDVTSKETNDVIDQFAKEKSAYSPINLFPDEMLAMVFSHLSPRDLLAW